VKDRLINRFSVLEVLDDDSLQQRGGDLGVPNALRIYDDDRSVAAYAKARRLTALCALRAKEQILVFLSPIQQRYACLRAPILAPPWIPPDYA